MDTCRVIFVPGNLIFVPAIIFVLVTYSLYYYQMLRNNQRSILKFYFCWFINVIQYLLITTFACFIDFTHDFMFQMARFLFQGMGSKLFRY